MESKNGNGHKSDGVQEYIDSLLAVKRNDERNSGAVRDDLRTLESTIEKSYITPGQAVDLADALENIYNLGFNTGAIINKCIDKLDIIIKKYDKQINSVLKILDIKRDEISGAYSLQETPGSTYLSAMNKDPDTDILMYGYAIGKLQNIAEQLDLECTDDDSVEEDETSPNEGTIF